MTEKNSTAKAFIDWKHAVVYFDDPDLETSVRSMAYARLEKNIRRNLKRWLPAGHEALDKTR